MALTHGVFRKPAREELPKLVLRVVDAETMEDAMYADDVPRIWSKRKVGDKQCVAKSVEVKSTPDPRVWDVVVSYEVKPPEMFGEGI
jgi:hypothetical protein